MKSIRLTSVGALSVCLVFSPTLLGQNVNSSVSSASNEKDDVVSLSPFTVSAEDDSGYRATNTLSGTRINTSLRDIGTSIQAVTKEFLADTGITKVTELLQYTTSTEVSGGAGGNFSDPGNSTPAFFSSSAETRLAQPSTRIRGLAAASTARNLYVSMIPFDSYNLSRVEVNRGANSILFGLGSPSGIINYTTTEAIWRDRNEIEMKVDHYGTFRAVGDFNRELLKDVLAVRVIALSDNTKYKQEPSFRDDRRVYGAITFRPYKNTTLSFSYENGSIDSTLPRQDPPVDYFTHFFPTGGVNHTIPVNEDFRDKVPARGGLAIVQHDSGVVGNLRIIDSTTSGGSNHAFVQYPETYFNGGVLNPLATNPARANDFRYRRVAMQNGREYLAQVFGDPLGPQAYILNMVDPTVFDFFNNTIDGLASSQYGRIEAFNAALRQEFFEGRAGIEVGFDSESYNSGYLDALDGLRGNSLMIDVTQGEFAYATPGNPASGLAPNPNYLRPNVGSRSSFQERENEDESARATAFLRHDFTERSSGLIAKLLGRQNLTVLGSTYQNDSSNRSGQGAFMDYDQLIALGMTATNARANQAGQLGNIFYLGDSVAGRTSASGLNLSRYRGDFKWANEVNLNYRDPVTRQIRTAVVKVHNFSNEPHDRLATGIGRSRDTLDTLAAVLQSYWWDGALVTTLGWRSDDVARFTRDTAATGRRPDQTYIGGPVLNNTPLEEATGRTKSYSGVLKVDKFVGSRMPEGVDVDLHYGWSENFQGLEGARNTKGGFYAAPAGETEELGFSVGLFNQKLFFRANWFETIQNNLADDPGGAWANAIGQMVYRFYQQNNVSVLNAAGFAVPPVLLESGAITVSAPNANDRATATTNFTPSDIKSALSKGFELEATYNITSNWRMAVNVAKVEAVQSGIGANTRELVDFMRTNWFDKPSVAALFLGVGGTLDYVSGWRDRGVTNFETALEQDGASNPQIRKWRANLVTNYMFSKDSKFGGFGVGGGVRYQGKGFLGFVGKPNPADPNSYISDVTKPQYGPSESNFDFWVSYERKIMNERVMWKLQLNIRNAFTNDKLIPVQAQLVDLYSKYSAFDGYAATNYNLVRIAAPRTIELRSTFTF